MILRTAAAVALLACAAMADIYMHSPRGSNDRNCERNVNRNNGNRLFDSQNNAAGGYACPRAVGGPEVQPESGEVVLGTHTQSKRMYYYEDSILPIEWTNQHGCGPNSVTDCQIVLQYACEDILDPMIDNFFPYTTGKNRDLPESVGEKHFRYRGHIAAPRDGVPRDSNDDATDTIPDDEASAIPVTVETRRFGMHESYDFYQLCQRTERNKGLYTADQNMRRDDQRGTRQNPNGNRRGLECPEERDYYPWFQPAPWVDIAVLTNEAGDAPCNTPGTCTERCNWYLENTFNRNQKCFCEVKPEDPVSKKFNSNAWKSNKWYSDKEKCEQNGFLWKCISLSDPATTGMTLPYPTCVRTQYSRVNHLGNAITSLNTNNAPVIQSTNYLPAAGGPDRETLLKKMPLSASPNRFFWQIPKIPSASAAWSDDMEEEYKSCVLRIRYNISTGDFPQWPDDALPLDSPYLGKMVDYRNNSKTQGDPNTPLIQDPYVYIGPGGNSAGINDAFLSLAVNTNQYGRTFQDRSYVFSIKKRPAAGSVYDPSSDSPMVLLDALQADLTSGGVIINLGVRGKRGNIVQTYPSVEYGFVPDQLMLSQRDWIHFQWTGSDYNPRRGCNDAEGGPPDPNNYVSNQNNDNARADRSNVCLMLTEAFNQPREYAGYDENYGGSFTDKRNTAKSTIVPNSFCDDPTAFTRKITADECYDMLMRLCFLDQEDDQGALFLRSQKRCLTAQELDAITDKNSREQHPLNCAKLNAKPYPYMDGGLVPTRNPGIFPFFGSRNNNFSNRNQPGVICVNGGGVNCNTYFNAQLNTLQDNSEFSGKAAGRAPSYCNDEANSGEGANNNGAASCIGQNGGIIDGESFAIEQGDNDSSGDGDKKPCEEFGTFFKKSSVDEQIGLAIGLLFVGLFTSWFGYYAYNRYRAKYGDSSVFKGDKSWQKKPRENEVL